VSVYRNLTPLTLDFPGTGSSSKLESMFDKFLRESVSRIKKLESGGLDWMSQEDELIRTD